MKYFLILTLILYKTFSLINNCDCGTSHAYNEDTNTCEKLPTPN